MNDNFPEPHQRGGTNTQYESPPPFQLKCCFKPTRKALPNNHLDIIYYPNFKYRAFGLIINSDSVALETSLYQKLPCIFFSFLVTVPPMILFAIVISLMKFSTIVWQFRLSKDLFSLKQWFTWKGADYWRNERIVLLRKHTGEVLR